jgi:hypothetical protein
MTEQIDPGSTTPLQLGGHKQFPNEVSCSATGCDWKVPGDGNEASITFRGMGISDAGGYILVAPGNVEPRSEGDVLRLYIGQRYGVDSEDMNRALGKLSTSIEACRGPVSGKSHNILGFLGLSRTKGCGAICEKNRWGQVVNKPGIYNDSEG